MGFFSSQVAWLGERRPATARRGITGHRRSRARRVGPLRREIRRSTLELLELRRVLAAGDLDLTFGFGGKVTTSLFPSAEAIAIRADGSFVVAGTANGDMVVASFSADGLLDPEGNGIATLDFAGLEDSAHAVLVLPDSRTVVAGEARVQHGAAIHRDFALARLFADGAWDSTFNGDGNSDGLITTDFAGGDDYVADLAVAPDGKIVAVGYAKDGNLSRFAIARYQRDGSLDKSFDSDGKVLLPVGTVNDQATSVVVQPDGKLLVGGVALVGQTQNSALLRLNIDGSLDASFGDGGKVVWDASGRGQNDRIQRILLRPDGKIIAAGDVSNGTDLDIGVIRYNADGSVDASFGNQGRLLLPLGASNDHVTSAALAPNGDILLAGSIVVPSTGYDFALLRVTSSGEWDQSFGTGGRSTTPFGAFQGADEARDIVLQPDGQIVLSGASFDNGQNLAVLARYRTAPIARDASLPPNPDVPGGDSLVSWWTGEGWALDSVGNQDGHPMNGAGFGDGRVGDGFRFDGVDDYVQIGDRSNLRLTEQLSIDAWVSATNPARGNYQILVNKEGEYELGLTPRGTVWYALANTQPGWVSIDTGYLLPANEWRHLALTYDSRTVQVYANGVSVHSRAADGPLGDAAPRQNDFRLGGRQSTAEFFAGRMDEVGIYRRALQAGEVQQLYQRGLSSNPRDSRPGDAAWLSHLSPATGSITRDAWFGFSTAANDAYYVVGAPGATAKSGVVGAGRVYVYNAQTRDLVQVFDDPTPAADGMFGRSVAISGDQIVVGDPLDGRGNNEEGAIHVFSASSGRLTRTIPSPRSGAYVHFGTSVAISGNTIVVGAHLASYSRLYEGAAFLFNATTGSELATLVSQQASQNGHFGYTVAIAGDLVAVGAYERNIVETYRVSTGEYLATLTKPASTGDDRFGYSFAFAGDLLAIGAHGATVDGVREVGIAYLFNPLGGAPVATLRNPAPTTGDAFGYTIAATADRVFVGALLDDQQAADAGAGYVFDATGRLTVQVNHPSPSLNDRFGSAATLVGHRLVVGAYWDDQLATKGGAAHVFALNQAPTNIALNSGRLARNALPGAIVGQLTTTDVDAGDRFTYELVAGLGSDDNSRFWIDGVDLKLATGLDAAPARSYSLRVRTTDSAGLSWEGPLVVEPTSLDDTLDPRSTNFPGTSGFGTSVAINDQFEVIGAPSAYSNGVERAGVVYVYHASTRELAVAIPNPAATSNAGFGARVALAGSYVIVSVFRQVYVFDAANGTLMSRIVSPSPALSDGFGVSLAASADFLAIGAPYDDTGAIDSGRVYLYRVPSGQLVATINNPTPAQGENFGASLALATSLLAVGAPQVRDQGLLFSGHVYTYELSNHELLATIANPDPTTFSGFGTAIALTDDALLAGAQGNDLGAQNSGQAYVFDPRTAVLRLRLPNPQPGAGDSFGGDVAISGTAAIVSARYDDTDGQDVGRLYVFDLATGGPLRSLVNPSPAKDNSFRSIIAAHADRVLFGMPRNSVAFLINPFSGQIASTFLDPTQAANDQFGASLSSSTTTLLVGAPLDDTGATDSGKVYLYDANQETLVRSIINPSPDAYDEFGYRVAVAGQTVVVSAVRDDTDGTDAGRAYVFDAHTGNLIATLKSPLPRPGDRFGESIAIFGDTVAIGVPEYDGAATNVGRVYLFDALSGDVFRTIDNPQPVGEDEFGSSIAIAGQQLIVGATGADRGALNSGVAYVFNSTSGALLTTLLNPFPRLGDHFGTSVAMSGNVAAIATVNEDGRQERAGQVYLYHLSGSATPYATLNAPQPASDTRFGTAISVSNNTVIVGAPETTFVGSDDGAAYAFDATTGDLLEILATTSARPGGQFGSAVTVAGDRIAVGAFADRTLGEHSGRVSLFRTTSARDRLFARGDFDGDDAIDLDDLELLTTALRSDRSNLRWDVDGDGTVTDADRDMWVTQLSRTYFGDANLDGRFGTGDLVQVFQLGRYEQPETPAGWAAGDWNGDGTFSTSDLLVAFQHGGFEAGPRPLVVEQLVLADGSRAAPELDWVTNLSRISVHGKTAPFALVETDSGSVPILADGQGEFFLDDLALPRGASFITVTVRDVNGNSSSLKQGFFRQIPDRVVSLEEGSLTVCLSANPSQHSTVRYLARAVVRNPLAEVRDTYELQFHGDYLTNITGLNEKWLFGKNDTAFLLLPTGELVQWQGTFAATATRESLVTKLDAAIYNDPSLLWDAAPELPAPASVTIQDNVLVITPTRGARGDITIRLVAVDGNESVAQQFTVTLDDDTYSDRIEAIEQLSEQAAQTSQDDIPALLAQLKGVRDRLSGAQVAEINDLIRTLLNQHDNVRKNLLETADQHTIAKWIEQSKLATAEHVLRELNVLQTEFATAFANVSARLTQTGSMATAVAPVFATGTQIGPFHANIGDFFTLDLRALHPSEVVFHNFANGLPDAQLGFVNVQLQSGQFDWAIPDGVAGTHRFTVVAEAVTSGRTATVSFDVIVGNDNAPSIDYLTATPAAISDSGNEPIQFVAHGLRHSGRRVDVEYWQDANGNGILDPSQDIRHYDSSIHPLNPPSIHPLNPQPGKLTFFARPYVSTFSAHVFGAPVNVTIDVLEAPKLTAPLALAVDPVDIYLGQKRADWVATYGDREAVRVWYEDTSLYAQWSTDTDPLGRGGRAQPPVLLTSDAGTQNAWAQVAADQHGNVVVVYHVGGYLEEDAVFLTATFQGQHVGIPVQLNASNIGSHKYPTVAMNANGDGIVAWNEMENGRQRTVIRHFSASGTQLQPEAWQADEVTSIDMPLYSTISAQGEYLVVMRSTNDISKYPGRGIWNNVYSPRAFDVKSIRSYGPAAMNSQGWAVIASQTGAAQVYTANGDLAGSPFPVIAAPPAGGFTPYFSFLLYRQVLLGDDGRIVVTWDDYQSATSWYRSFQLNTNASLTLESLRLADGDSLAAGESFRVEFVVRNTGATAAAPATVVAYLTRDGVVGAEDRLLGTASIEALPGQSVGPVQFGNFRFPSHQDPFWSAGSRNLKLVLAVLDSGSQLIFDLAPIQAEPVSAWAGLQFAAPIAMPPLPTFRVPTGAPRYIRPRIIADQIGTGKFVDPYFELEVIGTQMVNALRELAEIAPSDLRASLSSVEANITTSVDTYINNKLTVEQARAVALDLATAEHNRALRQVATDYSNTIAQAQAARDSIVDPATEQIVRQNLATTAKENAERNKITTLEAGKVAVETAYANQLASAAAERDRIARGESGLGLWSVGDVIDEGIDCVSDPAQCAEDLGNAARDFYNREVASLRAERDRQLANLNRQIDALKRALPQVLENIRDEALEIIAPIRDQMRRANEAFDRIKSVAQGERDRVTNDAKEGYETAKRDANEAFADGVQAVKENAVPTFGSVSTTLGSAAAVLAEPGGVLDTLHDNLEALSDSQLAADLGHITAAASQITEGLLAQGLATVTDAILLPTTQAIVDAAGRFANWAEEIGGKISDWTSDQLVKWDFGVWQFLIEEGPLLGPTVSRDRTNATLTEQMDEVFAPEMQLMLDAAGNVRLPLIGCEDDTCGDQGGLEEVQWLDQGQLSQELHDWLAHPDRRIITAESLPYVEVITPGSLWRLVDADKSYWIRPGHRKLEIFLGDSIPTGLVNFSNCHHNECAASLENLAMADGLTLFSTAVARDDARTAQLLRGFIEHGFDASGEPVRPGYGREITTEACGGSDCYSIDQFVPQLVGIHFAFKYGNDEVRSLARQLLQKWIDVLNANDGRLGPDDGSAGGEYDQLLVQSPMLPFAVQDVAAEMGLTYSPSQALLDPIVAKLDSIRDLIGDYVYGQLGRLSWQIFSLPTFHGGTVDWTRSVHRLPMDLRRKIADGVEQAIGAVGDLVNASGMLLNVLDTVETSTAGILAPNWLADLRGFVTSLLPFQTLEDVMYFGLTAVGYAASVIEMGIPEESLHCLGQGIPCDDVKGSSEDFVHLFFWQALLYDEFHPIGSAILQPLKKTMQIATAQHRWLHFDLLAGIFTDAVEKLSNWPDNWDREHNLWKQDVYDQNEAFLTLSDQPAISYIILHALGDVVGAVTP